MTVWNLGSINIDNIYHLDHLPGAGETIAATSYQQGLGGKGANMSVAIARAGSHVRHIGAVGPEGRWAVERLMEYGVDTRSISIGDAPTGHANIHIDPSGENQIVIHGGANQTISFDDIQTALREARPGDIFLTQNETNGQAEAIALAKERSMRVVYAAAPFSADAVRQVLPSCDLLILNAVEAEQLSQSLDVNLAQVPVAEMVVTLGGDGARYIKATAGTDILIPALKVEAVDTTGAGDTFTGYLVAGLDRGWSMEQSLRRANHAAALMVTRVGTADVIPDLKEIEEDRLAQKAT